MYTTYSCKAHTNVHGTCYNVTLVYSSGGGGVYLIQSGLYMHTNTLAEIQYEFEYVVLGVTVYTHGWMDVLACAIENREAHRNSYLQVACDTAVLRSRATGCTFTTIMKDIPTS